MLTIFILNYIYYSSLSAYKINVIFHNKNSQRKDVSWYINLNWHIKSLYFLREADLQYDWVKEKKNFFLILASKTNSSSSVHRSASHLWTLRTVAHQATLSMKFSRQEYRSGLWFLVPGDPLNSGMGPVSPACLVLAGRFFTAETPSKFFCLYYS